MDPLRLLLVDDEPYVVNGLSRSLRSCEPSLHIEVRLGGGQALAYLAEHDVDILITDLCMPGIDGGMLLEITAKKFPKVLRIVLSGEADVSKLCSALRYAHIYLAKPCDANRVFSIIIDSYHRMRDIVLPEIASLVCSLSSIPSRPEQLTKLIQITQNASCSIEEICDIAVQDPGLTVQLLKYANSSCFGRSGEIDSIHDAVSILGVELVGAMALSQRMLSTIAPVPPGFSMEAFWEHSLLVAKCARMFADSIRLDRSITKQAQIAALIHDVGKAILATSLPTEYSRVLDSAKYHISSQSALEQSIFKNDHAEIGAFLLRLWGLPASIVTPVLFHHRPSGAGEDKIGAATLLHIADYLAYAFTRSNYPEYLDEHHLEWLGITPEALDQFVETNRDKS